MQLDRIPTSGRSPAGPQSNQNVWVLPAISRDVLGLPARMGGLGLLNPAVEAETAHTSACKVTKPLVDSLLGRTECPMAEVFSDQNTASIESRRAKADLLKNRS